MRRNERDWAGQLVSWIKGAIERKTTLFQDVTNDTGLCMESGRTKFPDILLFLDKVSGIVFNGWELKFPDTAVDDTVMLENALEKARRLRAESFVTWNGAEAVIWKIDTETYTVETLTRLKAYPRLAGIATRDDLADLQNYARHEEELRQRAYEILHDLEQLCRENRLRPAVDVSGNIIQAIGKAATLVVPQFCLAIKAKKGNDAEFREAFGRWKIYEGATLKMLAESSRRRADVEPEQVLAKFAFYNLIGKIFLYLTLSENMSGELEPVRAGGDKELKARLNRYFDRAGAIDYRAVFRPYFTDDLPFSDVTNRVLSELLDVLTDFDFKVLPTEVIGHVLENLVPAEEKQKFGQYFTSETLACLVAYPAVRTADDLLLDPTAGTGTFLNAFYRILCYHGATSHAELLSRIWGNDVSHFPAILSVINLYKQDLTATENFPRVLREDFFRLSPDMPVEFPDSRDSHAFVEVPVPRFDGIASNYPFIQQEDIPVSELSALFQGVFGTRQRAFLKNGRFKFNGRSDYFAYCLYHSANFLKEGGRLAAITSNAWLGKEYGIQFKQFLLDNFHIRYVVRSHAEHWFNDSSVTTVYLVLEKGRSDEPARFVTLHFKLEDYFGRNDKVAQIRQIEDFYADVDNCADKRNPNWRKEERYEGLYRRCDGTVSVCIVPKKVLADSLPKKECWAQYFTSASLFGPFEACLTPYFPAVVDVFRGERTGWNKMFLLKEDDVPASGIAEGYLKPYVKKPAELDRIAFAGNYRYRVFVCGDEWDALDTGTRNWVKKFKGARNRNESRTIEEACKDHSPYWYSISPKQAHIVTSINPYVRYFFSFSREPFTIDQRLIAMRVRDGLDVELVAALLNSALTFLMLEMQGTPRWQGALDLNATDWKSLRALNPALLSEAQQEAIREAFRALQNRPVRKLAEELKDPARVAFDKVVLRSFGLDEALLGYIYDLLVESVNTRVSLCRK